MVKKEDCPMLNGSRAQVWHETAYKTKSGLTKKDLKKNKHGRIVSKIVSENAKKNNHLVNAGWVTTKGKFGSFQKETGSSPTKKGSAKKSPKKKGSTKKSPKKKGSKKKGSTKK